MHDDERLMQLFENVRFADEPAMRSTVADDVRRGRRHLRRTRAATWTTAVAGVAAAATGVAVALPGGGDPAPGTDLGVAADGQAAEQPVTTPTPEIDQPIDDHLPFPVTTGLLLDVAARHFDPDRTHLPGVVSNAGTGVGLDGAVEVSSKLDWTIPGETGMGMVRVAVTTPGYADGQYAEANISWLIGCEDRDACTEQTIPDTDRTVLVADPNPDLNLLLGVMYERPDGSYTAVGVYDLFGNNSLEPVSNVDITLDQAFAFVTDPDLHVDEDEARAAVRELALEEGQNTPDPGAAEFADADLVPAPEAVEMTPAEAQAALDACTDGVDGWDGFEPLFGMWVLSDVDATPWVVARDDDTHMFCDDTGAGLFGTPEVGSTPERSDDLVYRVAGNFGTFQPPVSQVVVQRAGGDPPLEAVVRDGYWYLPFDVDGSVPVAYRGYDQHGDLVVDDIVVP